MVAQLHDSAMDAAYDIVNNGNALYVIAAYAVDQTRATTITGHLATATLTPGVGSDFLAVTDGAAGARSRKQDMAARSSIPVVATGDATHVAIVDASNNLLVTTCVQQTLTNGNTVNIPAWKHEFAPPT